MKLKLTTLMALWSTATGAEISFLIYISQFQDQFGRIQGISNKDVCEAIGISLPTFYVIKTWLQIKKIISINYQPNLKGAFWEVQITDNIFLKEKDLKKGYLNMNYEILHRKEFHSLKRAEKVIILHLLTLKRDYRKTIRISVDTLTGWTGSQRRSVLSYISNLTLLDEFFDITMEEDIVVFNANTKCFTRRSASEKDIYHNHLLKLLLHETKVSASENQIEDVLILFKQYAKIGFGKIIGLIHYCLIKTRELIPQYINTIINKDIDKEFNWN